MILICFGELALFDDGGVGLDGLAIPAAVVLAQAPQWLPIVN